MLDPAVLQNGGGICHPYSKPMPIQTSNERTPRRSSVSSHRSSVNPTDREIDKKPKTVNCLGCLNENEKTSPIRSLRNRYPGTSIFAKPTPVPSITRQPNSIWDNIKGKVGADSKTAEVIDSYSKSFKTKPSNIIAAESLKKRSLMVDSLMVFLVGISYVGVHTLLPLLFPGLGAAVIVAVATGLAIATMGINALYYLAGDGERHEGRTRLERFGGLLRQIPHLVMAFGIVWPPLLFIHLLSFTILTATALIARARIGGENGEFAKQMQSEAEEIEREMRESGVEEASIALVMTRLESRKLELLKIYRKSALWGAVSRVLSSATVVFLIAVNFIPGFQIGLIPLAILLVILSVFTNYTYYKTDTIPYVARFHLSSHDNVIKNLTKDGSTLKFVERYRYAWKSDTRFLEQMKRYFMGLLRSLLVLAPPERKRRELSFENSTQRPFTAETEQY